MILREFLREHTRHFQGVPWEQQEEMQILKNSKELMKKQSINFYGTFDQYRDDYKGFTRKYWEILRST